MHQILTIFFISIFLFDNKAIQYKEGTKSDLEPKVIDIHTSPVPMVNQWVTLRQRSTGELKIDVEVINTKEVRFWTVPVRNKSWQESWEHRKLISIDRDGSDGWSSIFYYGEKNLLSFIVVEAVGYNNKSDRRPFYVIYRK